ncbi:ankyrin repeat domain-containing protein, partial [bacterium]|nr:ankyrin repeat domain-containing protein [bacterium]
LVPTVLVKSCLKRHYEIHTTNQPCSSLYCFCAFGGFRAAERARLAALDKFYSAGKLGNIEAVKLGLEEGANVNVKDKWGQTLLHHAANEDRKEIVELLIAAGADVKAKDEDGVTPLHFTAANRRKEVAELLIVKGANVNAENDDGDTPVDWAIEYNQIEIVDFLRKNGAKTSAELKSSQN